MRNLLFLLLAVTFLTMASLSSVFAAGEVAIYTGTVQWIGKGPADEQAQICVDMLDAVGIANTWFASEGDMDALATWMQGVTGDGALDVCVLYGDFIPTIYPDGNAEPDGTIAEGFIETTDGDTFINHADYMFWGLAGRHEEGGLQNMMDIPDIVMWDDNTAVVPTADGEAISPALAGLGAYNTDRPFHVDQLADDWVVEVSLAENADGTRADPIIVRDGDLGRLIPVIQTNGGDEPKGAIAAQIIIWLFDQEIQGTAVKPNGKLSTTWGDLKTLK